MVFRAELINNNIIKDAFDSISKIVDEVMCEIDEKGFRLTALDRSHITFVSLNLESSVFDEFYCSVPEKICVDTIEFMKVLKRIKKTDVLILSIDDNSNDLIITFTGDVVRTFKIKLIDMEYESPAPPSITPPSKMSISSTLLKDCLSDMELFGEKLYFKIDEDYFYAGADSDFGDSTFKYLHGEGNIVGEFKSNFSIPKLKDILSASKFSEYVTLELGNDIPLILRFELVTGDGELMFLLAPRIEAEDEY